MKWLISNLVLLLLFSCTQGSADNPNNSVNESSAKMIKLSKTDTFPSQKQNYIIDKARRSEEIDAQFPYDIELKRADGSKVVSSEIFEKNDRPKVLLFWLTTCYPCRLEMKAIEEHYDDWQKEQAFDLYAISTDFQKNFPAFTKRVNQSQWPWLSINDHNREFRQIMPGKLNGLPQLFILDKNGQIAYHKKKYSPGDEIQLFEEIKKVAAL